MWPTLRRQQFNLAIQPLSWGRGITLNLKRKKMCDPRWEDLTICLSWNWTQVLASVNVRFTSYHPSVLRIALCWLNCNCLLYYNRHSPVILIHIINWSAHFFLFEVGEGYGVAKLNDNAHFNWCAHLFLFEVGEGYGVAKLNDNAQ